MLIVKSNKSAEAGNMPSQELMSAMAAYNEELMKARVLVDLSGLRPSSDGARVQFSGGKRTVIDGPFAETKELIGGYWIINVKSKEEAVQWALRAPAPHGEGQDGEIEIRQFFEWEDFARGEATDRERALGDELAKKSA
ncbi:MAG TPA: YciI family protein [Bryobacteraceae bacterium]|nr:YciI family protein [Bryobacteraceae bacterium]